MSGNTSTITSALVTAGATADSIDDVRIVRLTRLPVGAEVNELTHLEFSNIFSGRFGWSIARALAERGVRVTLLGSKEALGQGTLPKGVTAHPFQTFADLAGLLEEKLMAEQPGAIFMSAAVADYSPSKVSGKISSSKKRLRIELMPNPKLIDRFRSLTGPNSLLVGFKVLSGVTDEVMHAYQVRQMERAGSDFCVGNDLARCDFANDVRRVRILSRDGRLWRMTGGAWTLAERLVKLILKQHQKV